MAGKPGRPKKVVVDTNDAVDFSSGYGSSSGLTKGVVLSGAGGPEFIKGGGFGPVPDVYFDSALYQASAVIAGAMAAGQGGWAPVISKTAVKVAKELLEIVKEG